MRTTILRLAPVLLLALVACDDAPEAACLNEAVTDCAPLYAPTFSNVYQRTLSTSCALGGGACHGADTTASTLSLVDEDQAHAALMAHVSPGDAVCSPLSTRLSGIGGDQMPPGTPLDAAAICAIRQWIANGAER